MSVTNRSKRRGKILDEILQYHRNQLPKIKRVTPEANLRALTVVSEPALDFCAALSRPGVALIAECKKASPSKGLMVPDYDAVELAGDYVWGGASAISVLTDKRHFQGDLNDLVMVKETSLAEMRKMSNIDPRKKIGVPVLRKDFIFDPYQIYEARVAGADAVLLIASVLSAEEMKALLALTHRLGMTALVEVHNEAEIEAVLPLKPRVIGINNRDLQTFKVDFDNSAHLVSLLPDDVIKVGESGIRMMWDIELMRDIGMDAVLVGEHLATDQNRLSRVKQFVRAGLPV